MKNRQQYIAISVLWTNIFNKCIESGGTPQFPINVWNFYNSLLDLGDDKELKIKTIVKKYYIEEWRPLVDSIIEENLKNAFSETGGKQSQIKKDIENLYITELYKKIIETIQKSGIGWTIGKQGNIGGGGIGFEENLDVEYKI